MMRIWLAFKAFFKILGNRAFAEAVQQVAEGRKSPISAAPSTPPVQLPPSPRPPRAFRSDAINLLAVLQREGRLIDFLKEDLSAYNDAQIGAAVRDVHRDCAAAVERLFGLRPVRNDPEGASIEVPAGFDAAKVRLTGNVTGSGPYRGVIRHGGWEASKVELPEWTGGEESARVVAPAEVEVP